eukprot:TRINITY_DN20197_c0_g1_i2.p1 TRINITY_DN20197_c0_g1~~TRINITY_DN20197_c0_g1_i2.p1  ORF type:complete len:335 (+),score=73.47 TRINITY_DN20197_c0_g1_i2:80-1006(+)
MSALLRSGLQAALLLTTLRLCVLADDENENLSLEEKYRQMFSRTTPLDQLPMLLDPPAQAMEFMGNCSYFFKKRKFVNMWTKVKELRDTLRTLHDAHDLRCRQKPAGPILDLGHVDASAIADKAASLGEDVWLGDATRQERFKVHQKTQSLLFLWKGTLSSEREEKPLWKDFKALLEPAVRAACKHYGYAYEQVDLWKAMLARLPPGAAVLPHTDVAPALVFPHRIHWAISGTEGVKTFIKGEEVPIAAGKLFEFNNIELHAIQNDGKDYRIHAIFDLVPRQLPEKFKITDYPEPKALYVSDDYYSEL